MLRRKERYKLQQKSNLAGVPHGGTGRAVGGCAETHTTLPGAPTFGTNPTKRRPTHSTSLDRQLDHTFLEYQHTNNRTLVILATAFLLTSAAQAQFDDAVATADAGATIIAPISITSLVDLHFGDIVPADSAGSVELTPAGARSSSGVTLGSGDDVTVATFSVSGDPDATFAITLPVSSTLTGPGDSMTVDEYSSSPETGLLDSSGDATLAVGATLNVGASQVAGAYTGIFDVTVAYN